MNLKRLEHFWQRLRKRPISTFILSSVGLLLLVLVFAATGFFGEIGRRLAFMPNTPDRPPISPHVGEGQDDTRSLNGSDAAEALGREKNADGIRREEATIAADADNFSSMSLEEHFDTWYAGTDLQRDEFTHQMRGKTVIWTAKIDSIKSGDGGGVSVVVSPVDRSYGHAYLDFDETQRGEFLRLAEGQVIRFTGVIRSESAGLSLKDCRLLRAIKSDA